MTDRSDDLDDHQDISAQKATETRRQHLHKIQADQAALQRRQEELNKPILAASPEAWPEAAGTGRGIMYSFPPPVRHKTRSPRDSSRTCSTT
jgi:hypothetical protein